MAVDIKKLKQIREQTGAGVADIRKALEETNNDEEKSVTLLKEWGIAKASKKADREASAGSIDTYIHSGGKVGAMVEINCETDFVARTDDFKTLTHEIAMQVAAMNPKDVDELLKQQYIRDSSQTIEQMVKATIGKLGENIVVRRFERFELGA